MGNKTGWVVLGITCLVVIVFGIYGIIGAIAFYVVLFVFGRDPIFRLPIDIPLSGVDPERGTLSSDGQSSMEYVMGYYLDVCPNCRRVYSTGAVSSIAQTCVSDFYTLMRVSVPKNVYTAFIDFIHKGHPQNA